MSGEGPLVRRVAAAQVIVIGASLGGTTALRTLFAALPGRRASTACARTARCTTSWS